MRASVQKILSTVFTLIIIGAIVLSGPSSALTLDLLLPNTRVDEGDEFTFTAFIDIHDGDLLFSNTSVNVSIMRGNTLVDTCIFDLEGTSISECSSLRVTSVASTVDAPQSDYGRVYGYGAQGEGWYNQSVQGFGYSSALGAGESSYTASASSGEFRYSMAWTSNAVSSDTSYTIVYTASIQGGNSATIIDQGENSITVDDTSSSSSTSTSTRRDTPQQSVIPSNEEILPTHSRYFTGLKVGQRIDYSINHIEIPLTHVNFSVENSTGPVTLTTTTLTTLPGSLRQQLLANGRYRAYSFIEIDDADKLAGKIGGDILLDFRVEQDWIDQELIEDILFFEWTNGEWVKQEANFAKSFGTTQYYHTRASDLGVYAIVGLSTTLLTSSGVALEGEVEVPFVNRSFLPAVDNSTNTSQVPLPQDNSQSTQLFIIIGGTLLLGALIAFYFYHKHVKHL